MLQKFGMVTSGIAVLCVCGCSSDKGAEESQAPAFQDLALVLKVPADSKLGNYVESDVLDWSGRSGADVAIQTYAPGDEFQPGDVVVLALEDLAAMHGRLADIPEGQPGTAELDFSSLLRGVRDRIAGAGGRPAVMPLSCPTLVCAYRVDLLEASKLKPPQTWDDYHVLVEAISEWAPGLGVAEPLGPQDRMLGIAARAAAHSCPEGSVGLFFDLQTGKPNTANPGFTRALTKLKQIAPALGKSWEYSVADCRRELLAGRAAIGLMYEPSIATATPVARPETGELGFCRLPGTKQVHDRLLENWKDVELNQPGLVGRDGLVICVVKGDTTANLAGLSLVAAVSDRLMKSVDTKVRGIVAEWQSDTAPDLYQPLTHKEARGYVSASVSSVNTRSLIQSQPFPQQDRFARALSETITAESLSNDLPQQLGEDLSLKWSSIIEEIGSDTFLKTYRWCNGLSL